MAAQKEAIKEGSFALREFEVLQRIFRPNGRAGQRVGLRRHTGKLQFTDFAAAVKCCGAKREMTGCDLEHRRQLRPVTRNFWRTGGLYKYYFGPVTGHMPGRARGFSPLLLHIGGSTPNEPPFFFGTDEKDPHNDRADPLCAAKEPALPTAWLFAHGARR